MIPEIVLFSAFTTTAILSFNERHIICNKINVVKVTSVLCFVETALRIATMLICSVGIYVFDNSKSVHGLLVIMRFLSSSSTFDVDDVTRSYSTGGLWWYSIWNLIWAVAFAIIGDLLRRYQQFNQDKALRPDTAVEQVPLASVVTQPSVIVQPAVQTDPAPAYTSPVITQTKN